MTATTALTTDLQHQVLLLEDDLRARVAADPEVEGRWKQEYQRAFEKERTAASWTAWRDDRVTQAAVAWVLISVFIRFCEDNALVGPVWIAGPDQQRRQEALDAQLAFFRTHPEDTDREWLQSAIDHLAVLPATKALVDSRSAHRLVSPSGNAVTRLLDFWRDRTEDGTLVHDLRDPPLSTRFLGDLYQDLSQHAKDTYALLQTPVFVEEFILDRTLEPALKERPLEGLRLIDPTCGSGHFLLGALDRLLDRWHKHAPGLELQARVQAALDAIHGVDLNPFAVAIARFRLTVAALQASGLSSLEAAPAFTFHLAVGDSLIHGPDPGVLTGMSDRTAYMSFTYSTEDGPLLLEMLEEGSYDVVVGNPPYITVTDKALNQIYRSKYSDVCKGTYALTVPFTELFFSLARDGSRSGWAGYIMSNSFMKRDFGSKLIEDFLATKDLQLVIDTSLAHIPNHGTPTVILIGRNRRPIEPTVRAAMGIRREARNPEKPSEGKVWKSIIDHIDVLGWDDGWITVKDLGRDLLSKHPWSLTGGAAVAVQQAVELNTGKSLAARGVKVGGLVTTGEDSAYEIGGPSALHRMRIQHARQLVLGESVRDYVIYPSEYVVFPYSTDLSLEHLDALGEEMKILWANKTTLMARKRFSKPVSTIKGFTWFEYRELYKQRLGSSAIAVFRKIATHNHAAMDHDGHLFREACHGMVAQDVTALLGVIAVLNSSTACFWLKQQSYDKGAGGISEGVKAEGWEHFREFAGATVQNYPLPTAIPEQRGLALDGLAQALTLALQAPLGARQGEVPTASTLTGARIAANNLRQKMVAAQEELDWEVYRLYGLIDRDMTYLGDDLPQLALGERAFEIILARAMQAGTEETAWFARHGSTPITTIPDHWPTAYRELVKERLELMATNQFVRFLETPEYKRRWSSEPWEKLQERALREWLLDRLEQRGFWFDGQDRPSPRSVGQLADEVGRDADMVSVLALWEGRPDVPVTQSLVRLLADEAVPYLAAYRYKDSGLRKREAWEETWRLQRREDAGEKVGTIPVPPKYTSADFRKNSYWQARGKLDVPKERFVLYPDAGRETDPTPLVGWAGWDHAQQALALAMIIGDREKDGWADERLVPLVAGLAELQPWVGQWHGEVDPDYGVSLAAFCREQLTARAAQVGRTLEELAGWQPVPAARGRRARSAT
jgi:hypothetical protein